MHPIQNTHLHIIGAGHNSSLYTLNPQASDKFHYAIDILITHMILKIIQCFGNLLSHRLIRKILVINLIQRIPLYNIIKIINLRMELLTHLTPKYRILSLRIHHDPIQVEQCCLIQPHTLSFHFV